MEDKPQGDVVQRAVWWAMYFTELLLAHPELREAIPSDSKIVLLPSEDPELCAHNSRLVRKGDQKLVYVKLEREASSLRIVPHVSLQDYVYAVQG